MTNEREGGRRRDDAQIRRLVWDAWNEAHIARHAVSRREAEEACHGRPVFEQGYKRRLRLVGPTSTGKMLAVVLAPVGRGVYYPVTARPASLLERRRYRTQTERNEL